MNRLLPALYHRPEQVDQAAFYGAWCRLEPAQRAPVVSEAGLYLDHAGMWLCMPGYPQPYLPSDANLLRRAGHGGSRTELARACGSDLKGLHVLDACAGYGSDGLLLAQLGARVCLVERDRLIWMLLHHRAQHIRVLKQSATKPVTCCRPAFDGDASSANLGCGFAGSYVSPDY